MIEEEKGKVINLRHNKVHHISYAKVSAITKLLFAEIKELIL